MLGQGGDRAELQLTLPMAGEVSVDVFDARGRLSFLRFGQSGVGSTIDMTLSITWGRDSSSRIRNGIEDQPRQATRFSIDPQFTYQFTRNLRGSLRLQYARNAQTVSTTQTLGVFFDAVLNF